jgi:hypothetical protein
MQVFTSSGTFTIPSGKTTLKVTVVGGGAGVGGNPAPTATSGTPNTGGGGGGCGGFETGNYSGAGGKGVVIIRYAGTTQKGSGGSVSTAGGYTYHQFNDSGTFTG